MSESDTPDSARYTLREERTGQIISTHPELTAALEAAEIEQTAWLLHNPEAGEQLLLVVTRPDGTPAAYSSATAPPPIHQPVEPPRPA